MGTSYGLWQHHWPIVSNFVNMPVKTRLCSIVFWCSLGHLSIHKKTTTHSHAYLFLIIFTHKKASQKSMHIHYISSNTFLLSPPPSPATKKISWKYIKKVIHSLRFEILSLKKIFSCKYKKIFREKIKNFSTQM